ncbi:MULTISPECIES: hypothetical protein [unclassified Mesorhizobium]|uniref:hypothetical protein n=1 Tax=unclassified Mesorhizobium TaxID=325217 RepID=UPI000F7586BD|nr:MULTISPECIES: hypothetical protein [unclassified Mesorhizobium]AZO75135.1 hypothetical protein EJ067_31155 [Mesorhizobium sp. M1D.F.Ca.ET.043.01.1.1]RWA90301.1 MAG: hypothetical protein EOQ32_18755 [Mesorhizobium sp.]RWE15359.1 MAG: hypothetical protein EOS61_09990 [Mesorhizobium sp.]
MESRPFHRVFHMTKCEAAVQQSETAITAFHVGQFAATVTLAGAAESMAPTKTGGLWEIIRDNPKRPFPEKEWITQLNGTRDWLKHNKADSTRNLVAFEAGLAILRAMDKWEPWTAPLLAFKDLWFLTPKLMRLEDYEPE